MEKSRERLGVGMGTWLGAGVVVALLAIGCGDDGPAAAQHPVLRGPVQPTPVAAAALPDPVATIEHSPLTLVAAAPVAGTLVDARVLVISADGSEPELAAIQQTLAYLGTPFDLLIASQAPTLSASQLASGTHGKYNAVILTRGNLVLSGGSSAFSSGEFQTLANYEAAFQVRRVSLYTAPDAGYGYSGSTSVDTSSTPLVAQCTTAGRAAFPYVNCSSGVSISGAFAYLGTPSDAATVPLLVDSSGRVLAATRAYGDGREAMSLNFSQASSLFHTLQLLYGVVSWATRGVFLGERHAYIGVQIDDVLIPDTIYTGGTFRMSPSDLQAALDYQNAKRAQATTAGMKYNMAFNGLGADEFAPDALVAKAQQIGSGFDYISHTYDHATLDPLSRSQVLDELSKNAAISDKYGLKPFSAGNLVPPSYSGLTVATVMQAELDFGIRFVVGDTSVAGYDNPSPNAGIYNPLQPQILMIPRRPTNLFYNVSTPTEWLAEYNDIYRSFWGRDLTYNEVLDHESDVLAQYLLKGENDPWMFHQPDLRIYGSGKSLLGDLLDQTFTKYSSRVNVPLVGPTMDELGRRVADRMRYNAADASGTIDPNANTVTIHVSSAATVPVTGACGGTTELYAGQPISSVPLPAGGSATLALSNGACGGTGGTGGTGATGGTGGTGGASLTIACTSLASGQIGTGESVATLATAELAGTTDSWTDYVELSPATHIVCNYPLPAGTSAAALTSLALEVNYRGPAVSSQQWTFEVLDTTTGSWVPLGDNGFATGWVWTNHTFTVSAPLARFFSPAGVLQVRYGTNSSADASDLDEMLIRATTGSAAMTGTAGTTGSGGTTGNGGTMGTAGTTGSAGTTGTAGTGGGQTAFSLPCSSLAVTAGQIGAGQTAASLTTAELTGTADVWDDYVELSPASQIVCSYVLPAGVTAGAVSTLALQVNYRGPTLSWQPWTFEVLDTTTGAWTTLGDNGFASGWVWMKHTFAVPSPLARFFSGGTLQIRYGTTSSADASDIDQLIVTGTR